jgi:hypothetical protein
MDSGGKLNIIWTKSIEENGFLSLRKPAIHFRCNFLNNCFIVTYKFVCRAACTAGYLPLRKISSFLVATDKKFTLTNILLVL